MTKSTDVDDRMEKGVGSRKPSTSSSDSSDSSSDSGLENGAFDPWAIVELIDDSEKWAGKLQLVLKFYEDSLFNINCNYQT